MLARMAQITHTLQQRMQVLMSLHIDLSRHCLNIMLGGRKSLQNVELLSMCHLSILIFIFLLKSFPILQQIWGLNFLSGQLFNNSIIKNWQKYHFFFLDNFVVNKATFQSLPQGLWPKVYFQSNKASSRVAFITFRNKNWVFNEKKMKKPSPSFAEWMLAESECLYLYVQCYNCCLSFSAVSSGANLTLGKWCLWSTEDISSCLLCVLFELPYLLTL